MYFHGYRPVTGSHHITIIRFTERVLDPEDDSLITVFERLRRTRHERLYRGKDIATRTDAENALKRAQELLVVVKEALN